MATTPVSTTLVLPVNRPVRFDITSTDVQHSFWIPAFAVKQDAVPGQTTHISATPTQIGNYEVRCAELCGVYHSYMETPVEVVTPDFFSSWIGTLQAGESARISGQMNTLAWTATGRRLAILWHRRVGSMMRKLVPSYLTGAILGAIGFFARQLVRHPFHRRRQRRGWRTLTSRGW